MAVSKTYVACVHSLANVHVHVTYILAYVECKREFVNK